MAMHNSRCFAALVLVLLSWFLGVPLPTHAQLVAECGSQRSECERAVFEKCPAGATVTSEQLLPPRQAVTGAVLYRLRYRCGLADLSLDSRAHEAWIRERRETRASYRLGGPITLTVAGVVAMGAVLWKTIDVGSLRVAPLTLTGSLLSAGLLVPGAVWLASSVRKRRAIDRELRQYAAVPRVAPLVAVSPGAWSAGLRLSF